ncbi:hypothetical protein [Micromonospora parastrephiae]|uniref:hypothetical protein n=1 Tax=Micromonospora parastrephiae TaxID=2806101 RepID=UPI00389917B1
MPIGFGSQFSQRSERVTVSGSDAVAGCFRSRMSTTARFTAGGGGAVVLPVNRRRSASWTSGSPLLAVMFNR